MYWDKLLDIIIDDVLDKLSKKNIYNYLLSIEYKGINEIHNTIVSKKILQFMLLHNDVTLILLKKRYSIQFEFNTFKYYCIGFNYFTIKLYRN